MPTAISVAAGNFSYGVLADGPWVLLYAGDIGHVMSSPAELYYTTLDLTKNLHGLAIPPGCAMDGNGLITGTVIPGTYEINVVRTLYATGGDVGLFSCWQAVVSVTVSAATTTATGTTGTGTSGTGTTGATASVSTGLVPASTDSTQLFANLPQLACGQTFYLVLPWLDISEAEALVGTLPALLLAQTATVPDSGWRLACDEDDALLSITVPPWVDPGVDSNGSPLAGNVGASVAVAVATDGPSTTSQPAQAQAQFSVQRAFQAPYTTRLGNNADLTFAIQHGLATQSVTVSLWTEGTPWTAVDPSTYTVTVTDDNNLTIALADGSPIPGPGTLSIVVYRQQLGGLMLPQYSPTIDADFGEEIEPFDLSALCPGMLVELASGPLPAGLWLDYLAVGGNIHSVIRGAPLVAGSSFVQFTATAGTGGPSAFFWVRITAS